MTDSSIASLDGAHYDVAIIGGGINGASAAQHLSAAGYRVLVIEQGDFADGATSRSSRLLHCGLRHLASGEGDHHWFRPGKWLASLARARHDMLARDELVKSIPHLLTQIKFCVPVYRDDDYAPWQFDAAFSSLRLLSPFGISLDYQRYSPADLAQIPWHSWLRERDKLTGMIVFREYLFDWPERIALDALFDAKRMGARLSNYTRVEKLEPGNGNNRWRLGLSARHGIGTDEPSSDMVWIDAGLVLNLAGASIDDVIQRANANAAKRCAGIKGIHIAFQLPEELANYGLFTFNSINEPMYLLPSNGIHYAGLTRRPFQGDTANVFASDEEIDWMIAEINRILPKLALTRADILYSWAGVNPVTHDPDTSLGSREIKIHDLGAEGLPNMLSLTAAPIVTHRGVARQLVKLVTSRVPPSGSTQAPEFHFNNHSITSNRKQDFGNDVDPITVRHCAREELVRGLDDLMMRRTKLGWNKDQGLEQARVVAEIAAAELGWSQSKIDAEVAAYQLQLQALRRRPR